MCVPSARIMQTAAGRSPVFSCMRGMLLHALLQCLHRLCQACFDRFYQSKTTNRSGDRPARLQCPMCNAELSSRRVAISDPVYANLLAAIVQHAGDCGGAADSDDDDDDLSALVAQAQKQKNASTRAAFEVCMCVCVRGCGGCAGDVFRIPTVCRFSCGRARWRPSH